MIIIIAILKRIKWLVFPLGAIIILSLFLIVFYKQENPRQSKKQMSVAPTPLMTKKDTIVGTKIDLIRLEKYLTVEAALLGITDNMSFYFKDLVQNREIAADTTRSWIPASTIKSFVMLEAFRQRRQGLIDFNQRITIKAQNVVPTELESDDFPRPSQGVTVTIQQLVEAMIIQSDNTAYNTLLDILDRRNINLTLKGLGLTETVVGEKLNLDDEQFQIDLHIPGKQPNTTTVKDVAIVFDLLYNKKIADADEMLTILKRQKINNMIPALLPRDTLVAHKTGDWAPIYHDGGIIYKPSEPFILVIFTNSNNPTALAQLARVAFYQNASVVGKSPIEGARPTGKKSSGKVYFASAVNSQRVLAAATEKDQKFPQITAADLGITNNDLQESRQFGEKIGNALITPNSIFYGIKRFFENGKNLFVFSQSQKATNKLNTSLSRLSEAKTLLAQNDFVTTEKVLDESENNLKQAVTLTKEAGKTVDISVVKQVNDLHYAMLAQQAEHVDDAHKEAFIDLVYRFQKKNNSEIVPVTRSSPATNPFQQEPIIGTVKEINGDTASVVFNNGESKKVVLPKTVRMRDFHSETLDSKNVLTPGSKVAIVGQISNTGKVIPTFILRNLPKEVPEKHEGVILEIHPDEKTIKIENKEGKKEEVKIEEKTIIKGKDTDVSLEGIKAGSGITVFGTSQNSTVTPPQSIPQTTTQTINATSVTVTNNSSGIQEERRSVSNTNTFPQSDQHKGEPKKEEQKKDDNKDKKSKDR